mmetsp:Transcript_4624/g.15335  ORF Transcript_4624/g.15335 Transcript_4624/m.15335 type:complete len:83 (+) Transcript_4624:463-711(+)
MYLRFGPWRFHEEVHRSQIERRGDHRGNQPPRTGIQGPSCIASRLTATLELAHSLVTCEELGNHILKLCRVSKHMDGAFVVR